MHNLFIRLWHAMAEAPASPERNAAQDALIRARIRDDDAPLIRDHVTDAEIRRALEWLYAPRPERRARQRTRKAITYHQRDQVAAILIRLARHQPKEITDMSSPRESWIKATIGELNTTSVGTRAEGYDFARAAEVEAQAQEDQYGDDPDSWDKPRDIADRIAAADWDVEGVDAPPQQQSGEGDATTLPPTGPQAKP